MIGATGEQLGILSIEQAMSTAQNLGLDLVEISPLAKPPVCKIMDYGKYKYDQKKKASESRKKQVVVHIKEIKLRPKTEEHDYEFKVRNIKRFLENADKCKVTMVFRGREMAHRELGQRILERVLKDVKDQGIIEQAPRMEGRQLYMLLAPNPKMKRPPPGSPQVERKPAAPRPQLVPLGTASAVASPPGSNPAGRLGEERSDESSRVPATSPAKI